MELFEMINADMSRNTEYDRKIKIWKAKCEILTHLLEMRFSTIPFKVTEGRYDDDSEWIRVSLKIED